MMLRDTALRFDADPPSGGDASDSRFGEALRTMAEDGARPDSRKRRILIVEDEPLTALALEILVRGMGFDVCGTADSAPDAIKIADREHPDLALMDIRLRGPVDGIQAAGELVTRFGIRSVFVSAHSDSVSRQRIESVRPLGFIVKPYLPKDVETGLTAAIAKLDGGGGS